MSFSVCVFCGSSFGDDPRFRAAAHETGLEIAQRGWTLVYGGARVGLMGAVADAALGAGGQVARMQGHVDGVVVGSALVEVLERREDPAAFIRALRTPFAA